MKLFYLIMGIFFILVAWMGAVSYHYSRPTCDWCNDRIYEKPVSVGEYQLHEICYSNLNLYAGEEFGCEYSYERMKWIYEQIKIKTRG